MSLTLPPRRTAVALLALALAVPAVVPARLSAQQRASGVGRDYTAADIAFMQGMIMHHAQAVVMSDWAATHGAGPALQTLARRIALSQRDEIGVMQQWLRERHLPTPDPLHTLHGGGATAHDTGHTSGMHAGMHTGMPVSGSPGTSGTSMPGMDMSGHALMPGMLTPAQMQQLDAARGAAFDSLYLTDMIRHHEGALGMIATLYAAPGSGQQPEISTFATDIDAGQRAEIARMQAMLNTLTRGDTR